MRAGPAVILRIRQLHVISIKTLGHIEDLLYMVDVEAMQYNIKDHGIVVLLDQPGNLRLELEGARAAKKIVHLPRTVLER